MFENINIQAITDTVFTILVMVLAFAHFSSYGRSAEKRSEKWKTELLELHKALKELIEDASIASNSLDRKLLTRKEELEKILTQLENTQRLSSSPATKNKTVVDDLPNPSWGESKEDENRTSASEEIFSEYQAMMNQTPQAAPGTLSLSQASNCPPTTNSRPMPEPLTSDIEQEQVTKYNLASVDVSDEIDPTTYRIAKRLISEGHEFSVIARKLQLPVAQVRLLERIIRSDKRSVSETTKATYEVEQANLHVVNGDY